MVYLFFHSGVQLCLHFLFMEFFFVLYLCSFRCYPYSYFKHCDFCFRVSFTVDCCSVKTSPTRAVLLFHSLLILTPVFLVDSCFLFSFSSCALFLHLLLSYSTRSELLNDMQSTFALETWNCATLSVPVF